MINNLSVETSIAKTKRFVFLMRFVSRKKPEPLKKRFSKFSSSQNKNFHKSGKMKTKFLILKFIYSFIINQLIVNHTQYLHLVRPSKLKRYHQFFLIYLFILYSRKQWGLIRTFCYLTLQPERG
ncbi:MAG TPA: hypothetical protein DCL08_08835 [Anaerolineaceae bacterium]|nr:hypothetical protein [Anaerolineaceae bacterium]